MAIGDGTLVDDSGYGDTSPDAERVQMAILRSLPVWRRLAQADQLYELTTALALADLRRRHPRAGETDLRRLLAKRRRAGAAPASERA
ncbi:MAG: hypothetical protein AB1806_13160 [Acidobacteriota bacterium]